MTKFNYRAIFELKRRLCCLLGSRRPPSRLPFRTSRVPRHIRLGMRSLRGAITRIRLRDPRSPVCDDEIPENPSEVLQ